MLGLAPALRSISKNPGFAQPGCTVCRCISVLVLVVEISALLQELSNELGAVMPDSQHQRAHAIGSLGLQIETWLCD